jgi:Asp-tRNA(Asn)/Glu-tRNA(Gln) amidotransferase A subunit family amidase
LTSKDFHVLEATIGDVHAVLKSKRLTCRELVNLYLKRIEAYDKAGPNLNAVQTINPRALEEADRLDQTFRTSGFVGPLHCIPVLVKDQIETSDMPTTYGSVLFKDFVPQREATIVTKLKKAGALILGVNSLQVTWGQLSESSAMPMIHVELQAVLQAELLPVSQQILRR